MTRSHRLKETSHVNDYYLDIEYSAFKRSRTDRNNFSWKREMQKHLSISKYKECEKYEVKYWSKWRHSHLCKLKKK